MLRIYNNIGWKVPKNLEIPGYLEKYSGVGNNKAVCGCCGSRVHDTFNREQEKHDISFGIRIFLNWNPKDAKDDYRTKYTELKLGKEKILVQTRIDSDSHTENRFYIREQHVPSSAGTTPTSLPEEGDEVLNFIYFVSYVEQDEAHWRKVYKNFDTIYPPGSEYYIAAFTRFKLIASAINASPNEFFFFIITEEQKDIFNRVLNKYKLNEYIIHKQEKIINMNMDTVKPRLNYYIIQKESK